MKTMLIFTGDEVRELIPYGLICETRYGCRWGTGKVRRAWLSTFTEKERAACSKLFSTSYSWFLTKGVPNEVHMMPETYKLWQKLGTFCASV